MMKRRKNINLFLMDGVPSGRIKCTLPNWTGVVYKIPRTMIDTCKDRADLKQCGVYFLFGVSDVTNRNVVYIGQAGIRKNGEGILYRLQEHQRSSDKDYWTEAIVFTTSNNSFGPTEISYLENTFCNLALNASRYEVKNSNDPNPGHITEEKESELEEFIDYAKVVMGALGHNVFEPISASVKVNSQEQQEILYYNISGVNATGSRSANGFVVFKGSSVSQKVFASCPNNAKISREKYADKIDSNYILTEDLLFTSPSAAAGFIGGASLSGNMVWKSSDGKTLKELEE